MSQPEVDGHDEAEAQADGCDVKSLDVTCSGSLMAQLWVQGDPRITQPNLRGTALDRVLQPACCLSCVRLGPARDPCARAAGAGTSSSDATDYKNRNVMDAPSTTSRTGAAWQPDTTNTHSSNEAASSWHPSCSGCHDLRDTP